MNRKDSAEMQDNMEDIVQRLAELEQMARENTRSSLKKGWENAR